MAKLWLQRDNELWMDNPIRVGKLAKRRVKKMASKSKMRAIMKKAQALRKRGLTLRQAMKKAWANPRLPGFFRGTKRRHATVYQADSRVFSAPYSKILPKWKKIAGNPRFRVRGGFMAKRRRARRNPVETLALLNPASMSVSVTGVAIAGIGALGWKYLYDTVLSKFLPQLGEGVLKFIGMGVSGVLVTSLLERPVGRRWTEPAKFGIVFLSGLGLISQLTNLPLASLGQMEGFSSLGLNIPAEMQGLMENVPEQMSQEERYA